MKVVKSKNGCPNCGGKKWNLYIYNSKNDLVYDNEANDPLIDKFVVSDKDYSGFCDYVLLVDVCDSCGVALS